MFVQENIFPIYVVRMSSIVCDILCIDVCIFCARSATFSCDFMWFHVIYVLAINKREIKYETKLFAEKYKWKQNCFCPISIHTMRIYTLYIYMPIKELEKRSRKSFHHLDPFPFNWEIVNRTWSQRAITEKKKKKICNAEWLSFPSLKYP